MERWANDEVPREVRYFAKLPVKDYLCDDTDPDAIIAYHLTFMQPHELQVVDEYIDKLLSSGLTEDEIHDVWRGLVTDYIIVRGHTTSFLQKVREQIAALSASNS